MNRFASVLGLLALVAGFAACSAETAPDSEGESGSAQSSVTRCGPPQAPASLQAASRCVSLEEAQGTKKTTIAVTEAESDPARFTFQMHVDVGAGAPLLFLFASNTYESRSSAEKGVGALLRGALKASNYELVPDADQFYLRISSGSRVIAETSRFVTSDADEAVYSVRRALDRADVQLQTESKARWSIVAKPDDAPARFDLVAGNNTRILIGAEMRLSRVEGAMFSTHELLAADYGDAERVQIGSFCDELLATGPGKTHAANIGKSIRVVWTEGVRGPQDNYIFNIWDADGYLMASSGRGHGSETCEGIIEKIRTVTRTLNAMPRG